MSTSTPSLDQLKRATAIAEQIQQLESQLKSILGGASSAPAVAGKLAKVKPAKKGKRTLSPEARARIVAAQKARWAKIKGEKLPDGAPKAEAKPAAKAKKAKVKRNISPEARARMVEGAKRRWAAKQAV